MKISQSWFKDFRNYLTGKECGNLIHYKWVEGKFFESTHAQKLGQYVEYLVLGSLPKDGKVPQPDYLKDGKTLTAPWRIAEGHAYRAKKLIADMGIDIIAAGKKLDKGRHFGTIDAMCRATKDIQLSNGDVLKAGTVFVMDVKYSGLLEDKWNIFGWAMTEEQQLHNAVQATAYHYITGLPFFYFVIGANGTLETTTTDIKFFEFVISESAVNNYLADANDLMEKFEYEKIVGFEPRPEYNKCQKCPLKETCADRMMYPQPEVIEI